MDHTAVTATPRRTTDHVVAFYERERFLAEVVVDLLAPALAVGGSGLVVATPAHRERFARDLAARGVDVAAAVARRHLVVLDAAATLASLMVDGEVSAARLRSEVGPLVDELGRRGGKVRIFGEMVALLWAAGDEAGALALEDAWNQLAASHEFALLCGYPMRSFSGEHSTVGFQQVCHHHDGIANEGYTGLGPAGAGEPSVLVLTRDEGIGTATGRPATR